MYTCAMSMYGMCICDIYSADIVHIPIPDMYPKLNAGDSSLITNNTTSNNSMITGI